MKILITESRMYDAFVKYINHRTNLIYVPEHREFRNWKSHGEVYGWKNGKSFIFSSYDMEDELEDIFGKNSNDLMLRYLQDNFPEAGIEDISE
jgi:hypothetical protein